jgi:CRP/FNR family transcriptional regulator
MKNVFEIISTVPLFEGLPHEQLDELINIAASRRFGKGEIIFSEGEPGNGFYVVAEGLVKIFKVSSEGKEQILHIFGTGEPFGEVPVFTGQPFPANAEALAKSRLLFFPRVDFVGLITGNPSLALNMLAVLSMRLRQFTVQIENLSLKEVPGRLASYIIYLAEEQGNDDSVKLNISKNQLASLLGTIPETLSRMFSKMTDMKLIDVSGRNIKLLDRSGLISLSEHGKNQITS